MANFEPATIARSPLTKCCAQFKFFNLEDIRCFWESFVSSDEPIQQVEFHLDPFYAECRAYGRINLAKKQGKIKRDIAIPCFGFIYLDDCYREVLDDYGVDLDERCLESDSSSYSSPMPNARESSSLRPIRGIVKQLASADPDVTYKTVDRIRKDIQELNRLKVYNLDVRKDNFRDGKLVDFGLSRTEPHCFIRPDNDFLSDESRQGDMAMLQHVVDEEGILVPWRTTKNLEYRKKLRSSSARK